MAGGLEIRDTDKGWQALLGQVHQMAGHAYVKVGILEAKTERKRDQLDAESGALAGTLAQHAGSAARAGAVVGKAKDSLHPMLTNAEVGLVQEFGSRDGHTPERSFLRESFEGHKEDYVELTAKLLAKVFWHDLEYERALQILGQQAAADVKAWMTNGMFPPLAESTIRAKRSSKPLIDSAQLRASITYEVVRGVAQEAA